MSDLIRRLTIDVMRDPTVQEAICSAVSGALSAQLTRQLGGESLYIAKTMGIEARAERDARIRSEWRGNNIQDLANRYRLSKWQIRRIVTRKTVACSHDHAPAKRRE